MNKKQFLWFALAMAIFLVTGFAGVSSALGARERSVQLAEQAAGLFSASASQALKAGFIDAIDRYENFEKQVLAAAGTEKLYEPGAVAPDWQTLLKYFSSLLPRSDAQSVIGFVEDHSEFKVMAYAG